MGICDSVKMNYPKENRGTNSTQYTSNSLNYNNLHKRDSISYLNNNDKIDNKIIMQKDINNNYNNPNNNQLQFVNGMPVKDPQLIQNKYINQNELIKSINEFSIKEKEYINKIKILEKEKITESLRLNEFSIKEKEYINKIKILEKEKITESLRLNEFSSKEKEYINKIKILEKEKITESLRLNEFSSKEKNYINKIDQLVKEINLESSKVKNLEKEKNNIVNKYDNEREKFIQNENIYKSQIQMLNNEKAILNDKEKKYNYNIQMLQTQITENEKNSNNMKKILENYQLKIEEQKNKIKELENKLKNKNNNHPKGLNNIGATCYMNATLQCLFYTSELTNYFLNQFKYNPNDKSKLISNEYYKVVYNLWERSNNNKSYSPDSFKIVLSQENTLFAGVTANDSKDLINFLLERLHNELNIVNKNNNSTNNNVINQNDQLNEEKIFSIFLNEFKEKYNSIISNLFYGILETKSQCQGCGNIKYNFQVYSFVEFPLEQVNNYCFKMGKRNNYMNNNKNPDIDLYECFEYNNKIDLMTGENQMFCNFCNCLCNALYGTSLFSLPNYLIVNLNRGKGAVYKCNVFFPEKLNLLNFVSFKYGNTYLELYGVISHIGPSSMSGHFIAYCKNRIDRKWYKYNDAMVAPCEKNDEYKNGMPYILFYHSL